MPLLDHFQPPLSERRRWHAFLSSWATYLSSQLNSLLPDGYFAEANVHYGIEIDVAAFEESGTSAPPMAWVPPPPQSSIALEMLGAVVEVGIFDRTAGPILAGAVELERSAFCRSGFLGFRLHYLPKPGRGNDACFERRPAAQDS